MEYKHCGLSQEEYRALIMTVNTQSDFPMFILVYMQFSLIILLEIGINPHTQTK